MYIVGAIIGGNPSCVGVGVRCFKVEIFLWGCLCECMTPLLHEHYLYTLGFNSHGNRFKINHCIE
jgi:hypothetical protein